MQQTLEALGLTPSESRIYVTICKHPQITTSQLISIAKVSRAKTYEAIERLKHKGLLSIAIKNNVKQISALSPSRLIDMLEDQQGRIDRTREELLAILPQLESSPEQKQEDVTIYEGFKGMKSFLEDMKAQLGPKTTIRGIAFDRPGVNPTIKRMFHELQKERATKGAKTYILCNDSSQLPNKQQSYVYRQHYEFRVIDGALPTGLQIYDDKVALFIWSQPKVICIRSQENADYYRAFFDNLWQQAGEHHQTTKKSAKK